MRRREWVVDPRVLKRADDLSGDVELTLTVQAFLFELLQRHSIALDAEEHIWGEYQRNFPPQSYIRRWWTAMVRKGKVVTRCGKLDYRPEKHLLEKLRFHDDDLPFVAVASKGKDRLLVAQESDYTEGVVQYLSYELHVKVVGITEALNIARDP